MENSLTHISTAGYLSGDLTQNWAHHVIFWSSQFLFLTILRFSQYKVVSFCLDTVSNNQLVQQGVLFIKIKFILHVF